MATKAETYQMEAGKRYRLFGAEEESQIPTNCSGCGAGFQGPVQTNCLSCGTQRGGYMVEALEHLPPATGATEPTILPANSLRQVIRIGDNNKRASVEGQEVIVGNNVKVTRVEADTIKAGWQNKFGIAVARMVFTARGLLTADFIAAPIVNLLDGDFAVNTMVAKDLKSGKEGQIETLHLLPGGSADIGPKSTIKKLLIGPSVNSIHIGDNSTINQVWAVPGTEISSGANTNILQEVRIANALFATGLQEALRGAAQNGQSISAPK